ncbi:MAG: hypothetical protein KZQ73_04715 [Candidatus Thiodiazotropha sp. (ex Semelilucina semeliformis)]|nr:hypothetical protein [Candidatus Thiodiazotropha sp. (ex Myrtea spinifera)]MCU7807158.1 hypothetical protein [Candidatus Thiodiazotropha sp. (ex Semelilucina semeliformis)]MCU7830492.1 hypothetical protein [Candidatus Thiodiazotropha sp. (ex Myrtea sp. 'scaly one' KF741663)]
MPYDTDNNRLLLEIDKEIRELNRETINPRIPNLNIKDLKPVMSMVARSRADYLQELFDLASVCGDGFPSPDQIRHLRNLRLAYDELVDGAQALNTAIERGYLDVGRD